MAYLLPGLRRGLLLSTPLILSTPLLVRQYTRPVLCDGPDPFTKIASDIQNTAKSRSAHNRPNTRVVRQISMGSILGVLAGMGVSVFSKPLALLLGLGIVVVQFLESRGIHVVPYSYLQRQFKSINVKGLIRDNVAFKFSFGTTFALAAFAEF